MNGEEWALSVLLDEYRPEPAFTVSEWADEHRVLSTKGSAEAGPWRTARTPYLREIMDCLSSYSTVETVAVMKGAQIGFSEAALNFTGYCIHHAPGPALYVMPTVETVKRISKTRLDPMIEASPALQERIPPARSRDSSNTIFSKEFMGGVLILTGANSASGLRSMPIRYLVLDEVDAYPLNADNEGDPVNLAIKRTAAFLRRKIFMLSTPGVKGFSRIGKAFRDGDQRYFNVTCDGCGVVQPITWRPPPTADGKPGKLGGIRWPKGRPEEARWECAHCGHKHEEHRKAVLMANGEWVPTAESQKPGFRSYHLSSLYSPWQSWADCAREFLDCHGADGRADPSLLQVFVNTVLGEEWEEAGEAVRPDGLMGLREDWGPVLPAKIAVLTAGVDVQNDRLEVEIVGWGRDEESWGVDYEVFIGDPAQDDVWERLDAYLKRRWPHPGFEKGLSVQAACVDTGGSHSARVYAFCHARTARKVWAIKGSTIYAAPIWPKKPSRTRKSGTNFYMVGVSAAKEIVFKRLARVGPEATGTGACHFSVDRDESYFAQLTVEVIRTKYINGFPQKYWWKPDGARNEALDCRAYAIAALHSLLAMGLKLNAQAAIVDAKVAEIAREGGFQPEASPKPAAAPPGAPPTSPPPPKRSKGRRVIASKYV